MSKAVTDPGFSRWEGECDPLKFRARTYYFSHLLPKTTKKKKRKKKNGPRGKRARVPSPVLLIRQCKAIANLPAGIFVVGYVDADGIVLTGIEQHAWVYVLAILSVIHPLVFAPTLEPVTVRGHHTRTWVLTGGAVTRVVLGAVFARPTYLQNKKSKRKEKRKIANFGHHTNQYPGTTWTLF